MLGQPSPFNRGNPPSAADPSGAAGGAGRPKPRYGRLRTKALPSGRRQGGILHVVGALFWTFCDTHAL